jgi:hypothetical protein
LIESWVHIGIVHLAVLGTPLLIFRVIIHRNLAMDSRGWKITFSGLIALAAVTAIAYFTGPGTADWTKQVLVAFPQDRVESHAFWGRIAFVINGIVGLIGVMGWSSILQEEKPPRLILSILIVLMVINSFIIFYTAHLGGFIRRMDLLQ